MKILCTLSDRNYLANGLALYDALCKHNDDFTLYYLCVDDYTWEFFQRNTLPNLYPISIDLLQSRAYDCLVQNHESRPVDTSDGMSYYHWALAPMLTHFILQNHDHCMYIDSDIMFYRPLQEVYDSISTFDVGLITHKHCKLEKHRPNVGYYNVGIIYFANSTFGMACCRWWRDVVVDTTNPWYRIYGSCGDQKYLEIFDDIFPLLRIKIIDKDVGHSAPWNMGPATLEDGMYTWGSEFVVPGVQTVTQPLNFHHFSHFTPDYENNTWSHQRDNEWGNCVDTPTKVQLYQDYFDKLKEMKEKYEL